MTGYDLGSSVSDDNLREMRLIMSTLDRELDSYYRIVDATLIENFKTNRTRALEYVSTMKREME